MPQDSRNQKDIPIFFSCIPAFLIQNKESRNAGKISANMLTHSMASAAEPNSGFRFARRRETSLARGRE
jgi:hypothetical protein